MYEKLNELRVDILVGIKVVPITFRRGFSGTGVKRRRELYATSEMARQLAKSISYGHTYYEGERRIDLPNLANFVFEQLMAVPDDIAKAATSKNVDERANAEQKIVAAIIEALLANWTVKYEPKEPSLPGQGVKWHSSNSAPK